MDTHTKESCARIHSGVQDTIYVVGGKWKLPIISVLARSPLRFKELQRELEDITPKVLSKELKELELNNFISRTVHSTTPLIVEYSLTPYAKTLNNLLVEMSNWGLEHRKRMAESVSSQK